MVYAFIAHTLNPSAGGTGVCRLLYSCTFGTEDPPEHTGGSETESPEIDSRTVRKEQLALVARQIQSEYSFRKSVAVRGVGTDQSVEPAIAGIADELSGQSERGVFRLEPGDPFQTDKVVVWLALGGVGFALVCEKTENRLLAEGALKLLVKNLHEHVQAVSQPAELLNRGDRVAVIVHQFLPSGRLVLMNNAVVRQLERDMDNLLRGK